MRIGQKSFVVFASQVVGSAIGFVATIYFARVLGAEVLGYYASAITLVAWIRLGGNVGLVNAMEKRISEGYDPSEHFTATGLIVVALTLVLTLLVVLLGDWVDAYVEAEVAYLVVLVLWTRLFYGFVRGALRGERKVHIAGALDPFRTGTRAIVQVALVVLNFGILGLLVGYAVGSLLIGAVGLLWLSVRLRVPRREHVESIVEYAKYAWLGGLKTRTYNDVDILILTAMVPANLVGIYHVAWRIAKFLTLFDTAVSSTLFPEMSKADAENDREQISQFVTDSLAYGGLIVVPGLFGGFLLAEQLLLVYESEFVRGAAVLWILIFSTLLYGYQSQFLNALNALDRPDVAFRINVAFVGSNVVLNVALIYLFGFVGAAIASAISTGIGLVLGLVALRSLLSFRIPVGQIARQFTAAGVMGAAVFLANRVLPNVGPLASNTVTVVVLVLLGAAVYFLSLFGISPAFRRTVTTNLPI